MDVGVVPHRPSGRGSSTPWYAVFRKPSNALRSFDLTTSTAPAWTPSAASRMDNTGSRPLGWRLSTETKAAFKATELAVYVVISSASWWPRSWLRPARTVQQPDYFRADKA